MNSGKTKEGAAFLDKKMRFMGGDFRFDVRKIYYGAVVSSPLAGGNPIPGTVRLRLSNVSEGVS